MKTIFSRSSTLLVCLLLGAPAAFAAEGSFPVEEGFLSIPLSQMTLREEEGGVDLIYSPDGAYARLAQYTKLMIDQPEIWIDRDSKYKGAKPDNVKAIADLLREGISSNVISRGYEVVDEPGPEVLYIRLALTDLYLKKEKRGILAYTPQGAIVKLGVDQFRDMMSKVDIIELALQAEFLDSLSEEVVAALVIKRGARKDKTAHQKEQRLEFGEFSEIVRGYSAHLSCRLDNARKAEQQQQVDCADDDALKAAGYLEP
jgi:hypothetical protein